jgi:hypothetical protein
MRIKAPDGRILSKGEAKAERGPKEEQATKNSFVRSEKTTNCPQNTKESILATHKYPFCINFSINIALLAARML